MKKTKKLFIGLACCASLSFMAFAACNDTKSKSFEQFYEKECAENGGWAQLSADGKTLSMDTRPSDNYFIEQGWPDINVYQDEVLNAIEKLHQEYNIPSYVYEEMVSTSANDGRQKYEDEKMIIFWKYSQTKGLEVTYGLK